MKIKGFACLLLIAALPQWARALAAQTASDSPTPSGTPTATKPELRGIMGDGSEQRFLLIIPGGATSKWSKVGDTVDRWKIADYREHDRTLVLKKDDGTELDLVLTASHTDSADVKALLQSAEDMTKAGRYPEALAAYEEAVRLDPTNYLAHDDLGSVLGLIGRQLEAIAQWQEALRLWPLDPYARANLDTAQRRLGQRTP